MRWLAVVALLGAFSPNGGAETEDVAEPPEPPEPRVTSVTGRLHGTMAVFTVRYVVAFTASSMNKQWLSVPERALVTRATVHAGAAAHRLQLRRSELALAAFEAIGELPAGPARRWAVLLEGGDGSIELSMAAPRAGLFTLELELRVPTCFFRDLRYAELPDDWLARLPRALRAHQGKATELAQACRGEDGHETDLWIAFPSPVLAHRAPGPDRVGTPAGVARLGTAHIARVELDVSRMLGEVPRDLATVIVVDASRSLSAAELEVQRELVLSYLELARDSRVQVIAYARHARALLPDWTVASRARAPIERALTGLALHNGSNLDAGLVDAARWLTGIGGTRRVVLVTDERIAHRFSNGIAALAKLLPSDTLVHTVALDDHGGEPERDDNARLAALAAATAGMAIRTGLPQDRPLDVTLLVRPISLDGLIVRAPAWSRLDTGDPLACDEALAEGRSCTWWGQTTSPAVPIAIEAWIWGTRVARAVRPDPTRALDVVRELSLFDDLATELADEALEAARAVNRAWSMYAEWGGRNGYPDAGFWDGSTCSCGTVGPSGFGTAGHVLTAAAPLPPRVLHDQLAGAVRRCDLGPSAALATIETTRSEIVDVKVAIRSNRPLAPAYLAALRDCVANAIWGTPVVIPERFPHHTTRVTFAGAP